MKIRMLEHVSSSIHGSHQAGDITDWADDKEAKQLIAAGMTNNEVAGALHLSAKTVSRHLSNIFTKIGVSSRSAATAYAFEQGTAHRRPPAA